MIISIHYYASLREQRGLDEETIDVEDMSLLRLYEQLQAEFAFPVAAEHVRPAVNDEFCDWDRPICSGDCVVFVPPVAGG